MKNLFTLFFCLSYFFIFAQKIIPLYKGTPPLNKKTGITTDTFIVFPSATGTEIKFITRVIHPTLTAFLPTKKNTGKAVIICPGGGYSGLAINHEGIEIAQKLAQNGITGFVLTYRLPAQNLVDDKETVPLMDAQRAIQLLRENAIKYKINPNKIGIMGSSAGGHLASTAGTHFDKTKIENPKKTSLRPDFMILNYPVISFADSLTHRGSRFNLSGPLMPQKELDAIFSDWQNSEKKLAAQKIAHERIIEYSNELKVTTKTPPTFITHAIDDDVVGVQNSLFFIAALQQNGIPVESFFYAKGGHGYGMKNPTAKVQWIDKCIAWLLKE